MERHDESWRQTPGETAQDGEVGDRRERVAPGRRSLTQTIGRGARAGAATAPGKISLVHRIAGTATELPYRAEMEAAFSEDFSGVSALETTRDALGGAGGMAQGNSVAFAGTPSKHTVAHELAHVVQHRQGLVGGEQALADTGLSILDDAANKAAKAIAGFNTARAKLPRPLVLEILGDRFQVTYEVNTANQLVFVVRYAGPYEVAGDKVRDRSLKIATPRGEGFEMSNLDASLVSVNQQGALFDLSGTSAELAELTFRSTPHETDGDARSHFLYTKTGNKAGESGRAIFRFDILLPNKDRPAPEGAEPAELEREKTSSALVMLGPDPFSLIARRFGESPKVHLHFEGAGSLGEHQNGNGSLLIPIGSPDGPVRLDVLEQSLGSIKVDLDGDGLMDAHLIHTAGTDEVEEDGTQEHFHTIDAYDREKVRVAHAYFKVQSVAWEVPEQIDNLKNPAPDSALPPADRAPVQGNLPTEGAKPVLLDSGSDWELRIDGDGDRQKELLLRFHQKEAGEPVTITAIQVSSGASSSFSVESIDTQTPAFMDPVVVTACDGANPAEIRLYTRGHYIRLWIDPPTEDAEGRTYSISTNGPGGDTSHSATFPLETMTGNLLASSDPEADRTVAGIRSMTVRIGELGDPFLFTLEHAPGGLTLGIAGVDPDGTPGSTSGHRLSDVEVQTFTLVNVTSTHLGIDLDGDDKADVILHDAIGQEIGPLSTPSLLVSRYHQMSLSGPAVAGRSAARFEVRGRKFLATSSSDAIAREGAGAAAAVTSIGAQQKEGADVDQLILRYRAGVSAQILRAGERGFISAEMLSAWKDLSEEMIRLPALASAPAEKKAGVAASEASLRESAAAHAATLYAELQAATTGESQRHAAEHSDLPDTFTNPYTGAALDEVPGKYHGDGYSEPSTYTELSPGRAAGLSAALAARNDAAAGKAWAALQDGVERWAQTRLERQLGEDDPLVLQGQYMSAMAGALTEIKSKPKLMRVFATFIADDSYRDEEGFFSSLPLQLWVWQDEDGETWHIRDLTNPKKPFDGSAGTIAHRTCNPADRPPDLPPHRLFEELDDKKKYPKGVIRYEIPGSGWSDQVVCHAEKKWYEWAQDFGLVLAAAGLTLASAGTLGGTAYLIGSYALAASAVAGAVGAAGELADAHEHGWLDGMVLAVDLLQIASGVASAGSIVANNLARGFGVARDADRLARLAALGGKYYVPLTRAAVAADVTTVVVMTADLKNKLDEIDAALPAGSERDEAKVRLLAMIALTGGLTALSVVGDLPALTGGKATVVIDTINGIPVAHTGGVRVGDAAIDVSPRLGPDGTPIADPNLHATARWSNADPTVKGLTPDELPWYRAWMEQDRKVRFNKKGEPEILWPDVAGPKPPGLEAKLENMVRTGDVAVFDAAWARTRDLDALREANGGHLDIDPSSPAWPTERPKLKAALARSAGGEKQAEEILSRYEAIRSGAFGADSTLHADQAARLGQVLPPGEVDSLRRLYPECEVYVSGDAISAGAAADLKAVDVVVVAPAGTTPDLMAAMEMRAIGTRLRPDPDFLKAHPTLGTDATVGVDVKVVTSEQLFGMASVRVKGKPPIELHRLDVPSGPGGQPYTAAELDAMNKAGYELDPATGQWQPRSAVTRAGLAGTAFGSLRGANTICGGALPSEAVGQEVLRKLALGDAEVLRVVGVEPPVGFDPRTNEWGLGQRQSDGSWVLIRGDAGAVDWSKVPGVKARGHSHPLVDPYTGKARPLRGANGAGWISLDDLMAGKGGHSLMYLAPSGSDFAFAAREGRHMVATPYVHLGGGRIGTPTPGGLDPIVEFDIVESVAEGVWMSSFVVYRARVKIRAGDDLLFAGDMWGMQSPVFSIVDFRPPDGVKHLPDGMPAGFQIGDWMVPRAGGGDGTPGSTATGGAALAERLEAIGLPSAAADPDMALVMARMDASTAAHLERLLDLQAAGRVSGLVDWYKGLALDPSPGRIDNVMVELREASRLVDEHPGAVIDLGGDARAPNKWKDGVDTGKRDKGFDIAVRMGDEVIWSSEVKTIAAPVKEASDVTAAVNAAADKVASRAVNPAGAIEGKKEVRIELSLFTGEVALGGTARAVFDGAGKISRVDAAGNLIPAKRGVPNPANLFDLIADNLGIPGSKAMTHLDRVTLVDSTGVLARYNKVGSGFVRDP